jgi:hypothetical protein
MHSTGFDVLSKTSDVAAPASGATVTLFSSTANNSAVGRGARFKKLILNLESSHDSAANGVQVSESDDDGTTWKTVYTRTYTQATDGRLKLVVNELGAPEIRVQYVNSANTLTTWRYSLLADTNEQTI